MKWIVVNVGTIHGTTGAKTITQTGRIIILSAVRSIVPKTNGNGTLTLIYEESTSAQGARLRELIITDYEIVDTPPWARKYNT